MRIKSDTYIHSCVGEKISKILPRQKYKVAWTDIVNDGAVRIMSEGTTDSLLDIHIY